MSAPDDFVDVVIQVAARDPSIARVLREICTLDGAVRASALELVALHLGTRNAPRDLLDALTLLRRDDIANRIAAGLGRAS